MAFMTFDNAKREEGFIEVMPGFWQSKRIGQFTEQEKMEIEQGHEGRLAGSVFTIPMIWNA